MFFSKNDKATKLKEGKDLYIEARGHWNDYLTENDEDFEFYAGKQWPDDVVANLDAEGRPHLTFNLVHAVVRELVGAEEDTRRRMRAVPVGFDDKASSDAMDHIWQRLYHEDDVPDDERETFEKTVIGGLAGVELEANPMQGNPGWIEVEIEPLEPGDIYWDNQARNPDYSDATHGFRPRWYTEAEFKSRYPEHAPKWEELKEEARNMETLPGSITVDPQTTSLVRDYQLRPEDLRNKDFFEHNETGDRITKLMVIRLFYKESVERWYVLDNDPDPRTGHPIGWRLLPSRENANLAEDIGLEVQKVWEDEIRWLEFTGAQILFDDTQPIPINRFNVIPLLGFMDWIARKPFGVVKPLKDPQREVNKRYSYELDTVLRSAQPGLLVEENAVANLAAFEKQTRTPGVSAVVEDGALIAGKVQERQPPALPAGAVDLAERAHRQFNLVAGIGMEQLAANRTSEEPVGTALIHHRRSLNAITPLLANFRRFQRQTLSSVVQIITKLMPDDQIQAILGDRSRWTVQNGSIQDAKLQQEVNLRDFRSFKWQVEMEAHADDTTGQVLILQAVISAAQAGIPMDPSIVADLLPISRDKKVQLQNFIEQQLASQAEAAKEAQQLEVAQIADQARKTSNIVDIEAAKVKQRAAAQQQDAQLEATKMALDFAAKVADTMLQQKDKRTDDEIQMLELLTTFAAATKEKAEGA